MTLETWETGTGQKIYEITLASHTVELPQEKALQLAVSILELGPTPGIAEVVKERIRQVEGEGWTPEHDDQWINGELILAAISYAMQSILLAGARALWPWSGKWWKPGSPQRDQVKAGALIAAEIDRLRRKDARDGGCRNG